MIYLIDDNKYGQMSENYKFDFTSILKTYSSFVDWRKIISFNDIDLIISNAACILIHDSLDAKEDKDGLIAIAKKKRIPYCLFSNGFTATIFDGDSITEIKKDRLYNNLLAFIDYYSAKHAINLKLLSLGQNYEAEKAVIIQDKLINGVLFKNRHNFNFEIAFPSGSQDFKDLQELFYMSELFPDKESFEIAYNNFEEKFYANDTTGEKMKVEINLLTNKITQRHE